MSVCVCECVCVYCRMVRVVTAPLRVNLVFVFLQISGMHEFSKGQVISAWIGKIWVVPREA